MNLLAVGLGLIVLAFTLSVGLCALMRRVAPLLGLVDRPGGRKTHKAPTPLGGGLAIWFTLVLVLAFGTAWVGFGAPLPTRLDVHRGGLGEKVGHLWAIVGLATVVMVMGLIDDRRGLDWRPRLLIQVLLAVGLLLTGARITLFGPLAFPPITWILTVFWVVGLTNAFNFLDNMDGLAAGVGLIAATLFVGAQVAVGSLFVPAVLLILIGALAGFLVHNHAPARLFMGDAGSNFLGYLLGALTVVGTFTVTGPDSGYSPYGVLTPLLVMAVPLYDTASVILIRIRQGRSPFQPDRSHFSHRLVDRGLTSLGAVRTIYLVTLAGGLGALLLHRLDEFGAGVVVLQTCCLLGVVAILEISWNGKSQSNSNSNCNSLEQPKHGESRSEPVSRSATNSPDPEVVRESRTGDPGP